MPKPPDRKCEVCGKPCYGRTCNNCRKRKIGKVPFHKWFSQLSNTTTLCPFCVELTRTLKENRCGKCHQIKIEKC